MQTPKIFRLNMRHGVYLNTTETQNMPRQQTAGHDAAPPDQLRRKPHRALRKSAIGIGIPDWALWVVAIIVLINALSWALVGVFLRQDPNSWMLIGYIGVSLLLFRQALRWRAYSVAPIIFAFLFLISYPARVALMEQFYAGFRSTAYLASTGRFSYSTSEFTQFYLVSLIGVFGLHFGSSLALKLFRDISFNQRIDSRVWPVSFINICSLWCIASLLLSAICYALGIGLAGVDPPSLPFRLTGILNIARMFLMPLCGWFLFGSAVDRGDKRATLLIVVFLLLHGLLAVFLTLSKAGLLLAVFPFLAYICIRAPRSRFNNRLLLSLGSIIILLLPITFFGAMVLREDIYTQQYQSRGSAFNTAVSDNIGDGAHMFELLYGTMASASSRITGGSELMAVVAAPSFPSALVLTMITGRGALLDSGAAAMFNEVFEIELVVAGGMYSGKALGLFGTLFLSGNHFIVFFGSAFFAGLIVWLELCIGKIANQGAACGAAFWLVGCVSESGFDLFAFYPPLLIGLYVLFKLFNQGQIKPLNRDVQRQM